MFRYGPKTNSSSYCIERDSLSVKKKKIKKQRRNTRAREQVKRTNASRYLHTWMNVHTHTHTYACTLPKRLIVVGNNIVFVAVVKRECYIISRCRLCGKDKTKEETRLLLVFRYNKYYYYISFDFRVKKIRTRARFSRDTI